MVKSKKKQKPKASSESDSFYILKIVAYLILGSTWLRYYPNPSLSLPLPIGALVGIIIATHDKFQIDRKIEYVVLVLAMFVGFWLPLGIDIFY